MTGVHDRLVAVVRKYTPHAVCGGEFQGEGETSRSPCADTLSQIPVSVFALVFGREGVPGVSWAVPWTYRAGMCIPCQSAPCGSELRIEELAKTCFTPMIANSRCEFHLDIANTETATMRWFDIWAAAIAADVRKYSNLTLAEEHSCTPELHRSADLSLKPIRSVLLTSKLPVCVRKGRYGAALVGELTYPVVAFFGLSDLSVRPLMSVELYAVDSKYGWVGLRVKNPQTGAPTLAVADG